MFTNLAIVNGGPTLYNYGATQTNQGIKESMQRAVVFEDLKSLQKSHLRLPLLRKDLQLPGA